MANAADDPDFSPDKVVGIGVDTTGSSPLPVDENNVPLALLPKWKDDLAAQCWLWKDHTSHAEAARITELAAKYRPHLLRNAVIPILRSGGGARFGNARSSLRKSSMRPSAGWNSATISLGARGVTDPRKITRGICAAGHKALYSEDWNGLPDKAFLAMIDPKLADLRDRLYEKAYDATVTVGGLCAEWARKLGLPEGIPIAIGEFDVHYGAIACGVDEGTLVKVIGTSTCDCAVVPTHKAVADIPGICGIVPGAILPGYYGIEAGQSAVGDIFKWWVEGVCGGDGSLHARLTEEAARSSPARAD